MMTIRDFAKKYQVPYYIAFNASYGVKKGADGLFNEQDLLRSLLEYLRKKRSTVREKLDSLDSMIAEVISIEHGFRE